MDGDSLLFRKDTSTRCFWTARPRPKSPEQREPMVRSFLRTGGGWRSSPVQWSGKWLSTVALLVFFCHSTILPAGVALGVMTATLLLRFRERGASSASPREEVLPLR